MMHGQNHIKFNSVYVKNHNLTVFYV